MQPAKDGFVHLSGFFSEPEQAALLEAVMSVVAQAPFCTPVMKRFGQPFSIEMTSAGAVGWWSDRSGYRYIDRHPRTDRPWPRIPPAIGYAIDRILAAAGERYPLPTFYPDSCLINRYRAEGRLGLHVDEDEEDRNAPILSISLGDDGKFVIGGHDRKDPIERIVLGSGDAVVMAGPSRQCFHGIEKIVPGTSRLIPGGRRINLTIRQVWTR